MSVADLLRPSLVADDMTPLLDEHHLVVLSEDAHQRDAFADSMESCLPWLPDTAIIRIQGEQVDSLASFCHALDLGSLMPPKPQIGDLVGLLRQAPRRFKRRYIIWSDADALLERDVTLFSHLVNALMSVAVEREFLCTDRLIVERYVFIGGGKLGAYAEDVNGQFWCWNDEPALAPVRRCVEYPHVLTCRIE
jgi:hypothetical protein